MNTAPHPSARIPMRGGSIAPRIAWSCAALSIGILLVGVLLEQTFWMLSFPVALVGAVAGGNSRRFLPMIICIVVAAALPLAIMLQGV